MIDAVVFSSMTFQTFGLLDLQNFLKIIPDVQHIKVFNNDRQW